MSCGFLLIALNGRRYGEMAYNLAVSLRLACPEVPIAVISDGSFEAVEGWQEVASMTVRLPRGENPFEAKTRLVELSPWERTCYIDADSLVMSEAAMAALLPSEEAWPTWRAMEYGRHIRTSAVGPLWAPLCTIFDHYGLDPLTLYPEYNSSIMLFTRDAAPLFEAAHVAYLDECAVQERVGAYFPDEVAFGVASARTGIYSDVAGWRPIFFKWHEGGQVAAMSAPLISMAGGVQPTWLCHLYLAKAKDYAARSGARAYQFRHAAKAAIQR